MPQKFFISWGYKTNFFFLWSGMSGGKGSILTYIACESEHIV